MKRLIFVMTNLLATAAFADTASTCVMNMPQTSNAYQAVQWYRDSAERNAIYREVFLVGTQKVKMMVKHQHLKPQQWGVIFDIDETLLDNSAYAYQGVLNCQGYNKSGFSAFQMTAVSTALPGAVKITCDIQKMGGYVTLVSNRDGSYVDLATQKTLLEATIDNLHKQGICFNQVVLASSPSDSNKTPRFEAVQTGDYPKGMVYSNKLPAHSVIAYFGDNIQDFPNTFQAEMIKQDPNSSAYDLFGKQYFALPNPTYGSWQANAFQ